MESPLSWIFKSLTFKSGAAVSPTLNDMKTQHVNESHRITVKANAVSLCFKSEDGTLSLVKQKTEGNEFCVNVIDCPGDIDMFHEVTAAICLIDDVGTYIRKVLLLSLGACLLRYTVKPVITHSCWWKAGAMGYHGLWVLRGIVIGSSIRLMVYYTINLDI